MNSISNTLHSCAAVIAKRRNRICIQLKLPLIVLGTITVNMIAFSTCVAVEVPRVLNYQGRVASSGSLFEGTGQFKFAIVNVDGATFYWRNDGGSGVGEPTTTVALNVTKGLFSARLGDTALPNMAEIPEAVFQNTNLRLRVWFNDGVKGSQRLLPDQQLMATAFAVRAAQADSIKEQPFIYTQMTFGDVTLPLAPTWDTTLSGRHTLSKETKKFSKITMRYSSGNANIHVVGSGAQRKPNGSISIIRRSTNGAESIVETVNGTIVGDNLLQLKDVDVTLDWANYNYYIEVKADSGNYDAFNQNGAGNKSYFRLNQIDFTESK
jgi:hypothetical protein